jgi:hypothetical protein
LAAQHDVRLDSWRKRSPKENFLQLRLVGTFEGVNGFLVQGQVFDLETGEPIATASGTFPESRAKRQNMTIDLPKNSLRGLALGVDMAWGDETVAFKPEVGATNQLRDLSAELVFLKPFCLASAQEKGMFAKAVASQSLKVECTTAGFFLSEPALGFFIYPKMVARSGREEIRYFNTFFNATNSDIRVVSMPIALDQLERIELHHRHRRYRAFFRLDGLEGLFSE